MDMDLKLLQKMISDGYVSKRKHPHADIYIYNYTNSTQFDAVWNNVTIQCRGLILDKDNRVISRPFKKFFNIEEHNSPFLDDVPTNESFDVFEKMDGSLGIIYWINDEPFIATRGSFLSDQAVKATNMLKTKYSNSIPQLKRDRTYLVEIIYPSNRIVVDYGQREDLVLLAVIDNQTGLDLPLENIGFPLVKQYDGVSDYNTLKDLEWENHEGFVVRFSSGFRVKVKMEEYKRLHRIITNVSNKSIWDILRAGQSLDEILDRVPDEFYNWVKNTKDEFIERYEEIEDVCRKQFKDYGDRKKNALYYQTCNYPAILFKMLDKKDYSDIIWKLIRPEYECLNAHLTTMENNECEL